MSDPQEILSSDAAVIHGVITDAKGSSPREIGARIYVTMNRLAGTIGGGQAEWQVITKARAMLADGTRRKAMDIALGPEIGQCCGGRIAVELQYLDDTQRRAHLAQLDAMALPQLLILGAGHVGRALARIALTLPWHVVLVDTRGEELALAPQGIEARLTPLPEADIASAPPSSAFVITTHDHGLDFLLTLAALRRGDAAYVGLIGSRTKRARFEQFARENGGVKIGQLVCPIGAAGLGDKRPEIIALMTAQEIWTALREASGRNPASDQNSAV